MYLLLSSISILFGEQIWVAFSLDPSIQNSVCLERILEEPTESVNQKEESILFGATISFLCLRTHLMMVRGRWHLATDASPW